MRFTSLCVLTSVPLTYMWAFGFVGCILFFIVSPRGCQGERNPPTPPLPWHQRCQNHCGAKWLVPSKRNLALPSCFVQFIQSLYRLYHLQKFLRLTIIIDLNSLYLQHLQARYSYRCGNVFVLCIWHTHIYIYYIQKYTYIIIYMCVCV